MVLPIPFRMNTPEVVLNRIEVAHFVRFDIAGHILVPNVEARQTSIGGKSIDYSLVHGLPIGMSRIIRTILRVAHHRIIAEHITVFQEVDDVMCLSTYPFFGTQFSAIRFCLCINSLNDGSQTHFGQGRIVFMMIPNMCKGLFLWYSQQTHLASQFGKESIVVRVFASHFVCLHHRLHVQTFIFHIQVVIGR